MMDYHVRTGQSVVPGHPLFPWMLRHTAWCTSRFQSQGPRAATLYKARNCAQYSSPVIPYGEMVMVRVPRDPRGPGSQNENRFGQWLMGVWVGRRDEGDGDLVLTRQGIISGKLVSRLIPS